MKANQIETSKPSEATKRLLLIPLERATKPSPWQRLKSAFSTPDLNLDHWRHLENRERRRPTEFDHRGRL